jgi:cytochrome P450
MSTTAASSSSEHSRPDVAPFITAAVGDVARPRASLPLTANLDHLPGEGGLLVGVRTLLGWVRRGAVHTADAHRKYGPVFRTAFANWPYVSVSDPELIAQILKNEDRAWSCALAWRLLFDGVDRAAVTNDTTSTMDFEVLREARKVLQPAFSAAALAGYIEVATPMMEAAIDRWVARRRVVFKPEIRRLLAGVSTRILTGVSDPAEAARIDRAMADFWRAPMALVRNRWLSPSWRRGQHGFDRLFETFRPRVAERRAQGGIDLFSRLCVASAGENWLDEDTVTRIFLGVMDGAFETTAMGLSSMAYLLARYPEWQERLREEVRAIDGPFEPDDARALELTDQVWKETLRLYPVTTTNPRRALRDVELGGYRIPAGALVFPAPGAIFRDPAWWTDPERFDPTRFSEDRAEDRKHKGMFLPFGGGAHACMGMVLAGLEAKAFWRAMLKRCRFRLARGGGGDPAAHTFNPMGSVASNVELILEPAG